MADAPERIRVAQDVDGFWTCREAVSGSQEYVRADLYAALEAQLAARTGGVKVKPLEWSDHPTGGEQALGAGLGLYRVHSNGDAWYLLPDYMGMGGKAAAQADYERRILSALEPAPEAQQEPVVYPKIMYCCEHCSEHYPEGCGYDRLDINVTNDGRWLCDGCLDAEGISSRECSSPPLLYTRPAEQAVTEAMVEAAHIAANNAANNHTYVSEASIRSALRAAMEAEE